MFESGVAADDLLSSLPDPILSEILSYLSFKNLVATCVLSMRWRHLWKQTPTVYGDTRDLNLRANITIIHILFSPFLRQLEIDFYPENWLGLYNYCDQIRTPNLKKITIRFREGISSYPPFICFLNPSLVELELGPHMNYTPIIPQSMVRYYLPNLKRLTIHLIPYPHGSAQTAWVKNLISSCPSIEELKMEVDFLNYSSSDLINNVIINSKNLMRLSVNLSNNHPTAFFVIIDCPKLEYGVIRAIDPTREHDINNHMASSKLKLKI
ncbi:hypothetical protein RND81_05G240100 [Saponaria officinalis]|uniref:F-box domain-containing protein n=1 Tax=Saponaria officinalis TaxID=3572 RepID=A0AAW1L094_SAPOF